MGEWLSETLHLNWRQQFAALEVLAQERSEFQDIVVFRNEAYGRVLMLDGCVQITEADEFIYQEMLAHVPLLAHGSARRVLIIGAGDGGVLRRVLQHPGVEAAVLVEIDAAVIRLSKQFLPEIAGNAWNDPRAQVIIRDGVSYVAEAGNDSFDIIIVDSTDPDGVGEPLFTDAFYSDCARVLGSNGLIVNQCGVPFLQGEELRRTTARLARSFAHVTAYVAAVPSYIGGFMTLGFASNKANMNTLAMTDVRNRGDLAGITSKTRYWTPEIHVAAFQLPPYIRKFLPEN